MRARVLSIVLLPDPLWPTSANVVPAGTSNETSLRAQKSSYVARPRRITMAFRLWLRSW